MNISEAIKLLESYVEGDIKKLTPKDRLNFWASLKEFETPKIQRTVVEPNSDEITEIKITYGKD